MNDVMYKGKQPDGQAVRVTVREGLIAACENIPDDPQLPYLLPVLVDLQHNGALGNYFTELEVDDTEAWSAISHHLRRHGVGRCLLTLVTAEQKVLESIAQGLGTLLGSDKEVDRLFFGLFHEGIFMSPQEGWRGAHNPRWIKPPDYDVIRRLDDLAGGRIKLVNVAPEEPGGLDFVEQAAADGKIVSLGHCCPDAACIQESIKRGATRVTHFGNGAPPNIHRFRNPFWSFLAEEQLQLTIICDGFHLPRDLVRTVRKSRPPDGWWPVSDAGGYAGCAPGRYHQTFADRDVVIETNGHMHLADSEILCGAWHQLDRAVEFLVNELDMGFLDAWNQCSSIPAKAMGLNLPTGKVGEVADFVLARWEKGLVIEQSVHGGVPYLEHPVRPNDSGEVRISKK